MHVVPIENQFTSSVSFINVGQGDSCLIRYKNYAVLIDTGGSIYKDIAQECLIPYFKKNRIYDIDLLITTHDDFDHNGAASSLINNFKVKKYITEKEDFPYKIGPILLSNLNQFDYENDNDNSLVIHFKMGNKNYLIMGDASKAVENQIMEKYSNVPCDILKIGHHGSDTSTSEKFVSFVNPIEAIVSVGDNKYGHPHKSVLDILKEANIKIRRTDIEGTITYKNYNFM
jgi:competence protein ComEC